MDTLEGRGSINWNSPEEVLKALLLLYSFQTPEEHIAHVTVERNDMGFNATDAPFCSSVAVWILDNKPVTQRQYNNISLIIRKYSGQINSCYPDFLRIELPEKALQFLNSPKPEQREEIGDGLLKVVKNELWFLPHIYPTKQIRSLGFRWGQNGEQAWIGGKLNNETLNGVLAMFEKTVLDVSVLQWIDQNEHPTDIPEFVQESQLFPFQKESVAFLMTHPRALCALAPGLGKTATAIHSAKAIGAENILVVCPLTLTYNWQKEIKKWIGETAVIWYGKSDKWPDYYNWVITNYETVTRNLEDMKSYDWDVVIIDESILVKTHDRTEVQIDGKRRWKFKTQRVEAIYQLTRDPEHVWLLSGAPTSRFYDDLWAQLHIIDDKRFSGYWKFAERYCTLEHNSWSPSGKVIVGNQPGSDRRINIDLSDVYYARTQDQVLDLPPWIFDDYEVPMPEEQYKMYQSMEEEFFADLPSGDCVVAPNLLSQMMRMVQLASNPLLVDGPNISAKWEAVGDLLEFEQKPAIVWTNFIKTAHALVADLNRRGYRTAVMTGETPTETRQKTVDAFQSGKLDVIIAHPGVGKFGLTLTAARTAIYLERSYNGDDYYQSLHRVRRIGTTRSPHVIHLLSSRPNGDEGVTIDHVIGRVLKFRRESSIALTSGLIREAYKQDLGGSYADNEVLSSFKPEEKTPVERAYDRRALERAKGKMTEIDLDR